MKVLVSEEHLTNIATAIRNKLTVDTKYKPSEMSAAIEKIKRLPGNMSGLETHAAMSNIDEIDFVSLIHKLTNSQVTKISDIRPYTIRSVKLSPTKVFIALSTKDEESNRITAVICTITQEGQVTIGNLLTLGVGQVRNFDVIALTENKVVVGSVSSAADITILNIDGTTITEIGGGAITGELPNNKTIKLAKIDNEKFVAVYSTPDATVGMCLSISSGSPVIFGNTLNESGSYLEPHIMGNSIAILAVNENKYAIFRSNPGQISNGITVFSCTVNGEGISKDAEKVIPGECGCSQVSATLFKDDEIFVAFGGTVEKNQTAYGIVCSITPSINFGSAVEIEGGQISCIDATTAYNNLVVVAFGGYVDVQPGSTKVALFNADKISIQKLLETTHTQLYGGVAIEYLGGAKVFLSSTIKFTENEDSHVGAVTSEFYEGVISTNHNDNIYGVAATSGALGETIDVCVPVRE